VRFATLALLVALAACRSPVAPVPEPPGDQALGASVRSALIRRSDLDALKIDVEANEGIVTLHGVVQSDQQRAQAERITTSVGGVKAVRNRLTVNGS